MKKIEMRDDCKVCGLLLNKKKRQRTFCNKKCREKEANRRAYWEQGKRERQKEYMRKKATKAPDKLQCALCGLWFRKVGGHARMAHKMTAKEYREQVGLPLKRGVLRKVVRNELRETAERNGTLLDGTKGKATRYKKGDKRAKMKTGYKGNRHAIKNIDPNIYDNN